MEKYSHQPAWLITEEPAAGRMNLSILETKTIHQLFGWFTPERRANELAQSWQAFGRGPQRQPLLESSSNKINVSRMRVEVAHEAFQPLAGRTLQVTDRK